MCFQLAREKAEKEASAALRPEVNASSATPTASGTSGEQPPHAVNLAISNTSTPNTSTGAGVSLSPIPAAPAAFDGNVPSVMASEPRAVPVMQTAAASATPVGNTVASTPSESPGISGVPEKSLSAKSIPLYEVI